MTSVATSFDSVRFDPDAFQRSDDGTWRVLRDTTIYSGIEDFEHTLLLPSGTRVEAQMFWANGIDLFDILEAAHRDAPSDSLPEADVVDLPNYRRARPTIDRL
jgi:hypothetical protein